MATLANKQNNNKTSFNMADVAAQRREERRRRITQNAEARMKKLLGKNEETTLDAKVSQEQKSEIKISSKDDDSNTNDDVSKLSQEQKSEIKLSSKKDVNNTNDDVSDSTPSSCNLRQRTKTIESSYRESLPDASKTSDNTSSKQRKTNYNSNSIGERLCPEPEISHKKDDDKQQSRPIPKRSVVNLGTLELIHMSSCVFTALVAKLLLLFEFGFLCCETVVLPFAMMELTLAFVSHFHLKKLVRPSPRGSLWSTALLLCGIKQELINSYNTIMGQVTSSANNFFFYIFSFIVWSVVIG